MNALVILTAIFGTDYYVEDYRAAHVTDQATIAAVLNASTNAHAPWNVVHFDGSRTYTLHEEIDALKGQTLQGHGATLRRADEWNTHLTQPVNIGDTVFHVDTVPPDIFPGVLITPVEAGGNGDFEDGDTFGGMRVQSFDATAGTITVGPPARKFFSANSSLYNVDPMVSTWQGGVVEDFVFDGNRQNNDSHVSWVYETAVQVWAGGAEIKNNIFKELPGQGVYIFSGDDTEVHHNLFHDNNSSAIHFSSTYNGGGLTHFRDNVIVRSNQDAERVGHSEGAVTISYRNDNIRITDNLAVEVNDPFIGNFGPWMENWVVEGNKLYDVNGIFFGRFHWAGFDPTGFIFNGNMCQDCGLSELQGETLLNQSGFDNSWQDFQLNNNEIIDGTVSLTDVGSGSINGLALRSCDPQIAVNNSSISMNGIETTAACDLKRDGAAKLTYNPLTGDASLNLANSPLGEISDLLIILDDGSLITSHDLSWLPPGLDIQTDILVARWADVAGHYGNLARQKVTVPEPSGCLMCAMACFLLLLSPRVFQSCRGGFLFGGTDVAPGQPVFFFQLPNIYSGLPASL
ncbi:MAG: hypothetical protein CMJ45_02945 [Planctomyces sp.]|nr:hypothetical protein [Planctomycetaceae bacterium]MBQ10488.1 hypothetical protein [Planctomyces sp.]